MGIKCSVQISAWCQVSIPFPVLVCLPRHSSNHYGHDRLVSFSRLIGRWGHFPSASNKNMGAPAALITWSLKVHRDGIFLFMKGFHTLYLFIY